MDFVLLTCIFTLLTYKNMPTRETNDLNQEEIDVYDRQIRVWGHEVQKKLKNYNILMMGLSGIGWEAAKNLILYGIKSLTIYETQKISESDLSTNLYLKLDDIGKNKAEISLPHLKLLNPNVHIRICQNEEELSSNQFLLRYDLVVMSDVSFYIANTLNDRMHDLNISNIYTRSFGNSGAICYDFVRHNFCESDSANAVNNLPKSHSYIEYPTLYNLFWNNNYSEKMAEMKRATYLKNAFSTIKALFNLENNSMVKYKPDLNITKIQLENEAKNLNLNIDDNNLEKMLLKHEFNPSCAIVAGFLCQELIKILSNSKPTGNLTFYDGDLYKADTLQFYK